MIFVGSLDRKKFYCSSRDLFASQASPTIQCQIQGMLNHEINQHPTPFKFISIQFWHRSTLPLLLARIPAMVYLRHFQHPVRHPIPNESEHVLQTQHKDTHPPVLHQLGSACAHYWNHISCHTRIPHLHIPHSLLPGRTRAVRCFLHPGGRVLTGIWDWDNPIRTHALQATVQCCANLD